MKQIAVITNTNRVQAKLLLDFAKTNNMDVRFIDSEEYEDTVLGKLVEETKGEELYELSHLQDMSDKT